MADLTTITLARNDTLSLARMNELITASPDRFVLVLDSCTIDGDGTIKLAALLDDNETSVLCVPTIDFEIQYLDLHKPGAPACYMIAVNRLYTRVGKPYVQDVASHAQIIQRRIDKRKGEVLHTSIVNATST